MEFHIPSDYQLMQQLNTCLRKYLKDEETVKSSAYSVLDDLIDICIMEVIFDVDIERKTGMSSILVGEPEDEKFKITDSTDGCVFVTNLGKKQQECRPMCPYCNRSSDSTKFAVHLSKCIGKGRNSSRIASQRIANATRDYGGDDDTDGTSESDKKGKKKKKKSSGKKSQSKSNKNGTNMTLHKMVDSSIPSSVSLDNYSLSDEKMSFS